MSDSFDKNDILDDKHWTLESYKQRMTVVVWRKFLLADEDTIICHGRIRKLVAKNLGYSIVEVSKEPLKERDD